MAKRTFEFIPLIYSHWQGLKTPRYRVFECRVILSHIYHAMLQSMSGGFIFNRKTLPYFRHRYNMTWRNERCIEIPIAQEFLNRHKGKRVLEIGNVLSHYLPISHDVL